VPQGTTAYTIRELLAPEKQLDNKWFREASTRQFDKPRFPIRGRNTLGEPRGDRDFRIV
jgi:hypothetical protein